MTRLAIPPGTSPAGGGRLLNRHHHWPPTLLGDGVDAATSTRLTFTATANASTNTVGSWVEVAASLSADVGWVHILPLSITAANANNASMLLNLGVGAGGSEVSVLPSLGVGWLGANLATHPHPGWLFPIFIPKGSRVAIQNQSAITVAAVTVRVNFYALAPFLTPPSRTIPDLGTSLAGSKGVTLGTPGGNNTEGAWTTIVAATTEPFTALGVSIQGGADTTQAVANMLVDVAIGSAGNEVALISDLVASMDASERLNIGSPLVHPANVPKGARLSARWQGSAVTGSLDVILHGVRI